MFFGSDHSKEVEGSNPHILRRNTSPIQSAICSEQWVEVTLLVHITRRLGEVYAKEDSTPEPELAAIQVASIGEEKW
jgi:hypothetical protein